jgi:hypothetical protein
MIPCTLDSRQAVFPNPKKSKNQLRFTRSSSLLALPLIFHHIVCQRRRFQCPHVVQREFNLELLLMTGNSLKLENWLWFLYHCLEGFEELYDFSLLEFRYSCSIIVAAFYIWSRVHAGLLSTVLFLFKRFFLICLQKILYGPSLN